MEYLHRFTLLGVTKRQTITLAEYLCLSVSILSFFLLFYLDASIDVKKMLATASAGFMFGTYMYAKAKHWGDVNNYWK